MRVLKAVLALTILTAGGLSAQTKYDPSTNPNPRRGFWIGFGLGAGSAGVDCQSCTSDRTTGFSGYLRLGGTLSRHLLLGGETNGWVHSESGVDQSIGYGSVVLLWYPSATGAFYLKFGVGGMAYSAKGGGSEITATAASGSFGLGYEFRVRPNMSVNLFLNSLASAPASFKFNGVSAPTGVDIKLNLVQLGVGLTWH
jgi:hypothetical protein